MERKDHAIRVVKKVVSVGATVILAAGAVTAGRWLGTRPDGCMEQLLASPSAIERWTSELAGRRAQQGEESKAPLVVQAEALAAYLNPSVPPKRAAPAPPPARPRPPLAEAKPVVPAPSLRLVGISYHCSDPAESRALIWESAGGQRWVRQGMRLGHTVIERINPGSILCRDEGGTREMVMERESTPIVPVRNAPAPLPTGGSDDRAVIVAKSDTPQSGTEEAPSVEGRSVEAPPAD